MRKKVIKFAALALLSTFALAACNDEIIAKPNGYDDNSPVVNIDGTDIYNNNFKDIYDSIRDGNLASDVLDQLLYQYAVSMFGNYNKVTAAKISENQFGEITLKQAVKSLKGDKADAKKFITDHKAYWTRNKAGERLDDNNQVVTNPETADPSNAEYTRLQSRWDAIEKRIAKQLYSQISGGSYSERNVYEEERFLRALASNIENNVLDPNAATGLFKGVLTSAVEDEDVFDKDAEDISGNPDRILHRENYQANADVDDAEEANQAVTYVEDKIIPDIYRQLLVEQYILDETYDTLGRTSARHISVLSIKKNTNYSKGAVNLMNTYVNDIIFDAARTNAIDLDSFKTVSNAWIGAFMKDATYTDAPEYALMSKAVPEYFVNPKVNPEDGSANADYDATKGSYIQGTAYGDMMEEIEKINENPALSQNESSYTGGNTYSVEVGKEIKTRELELQDHTYTGWYVKSVGVSDLPDSIKNQLFDINVANALSGEANEKCVEYTFDGTNNVWKTNEEESGLINVVGKVTTTSGASNYFLRNTTRVKGSPIQNDILFEVDNSYYIVLVHDAIRSKTLDRGQYTGENATEEKLAKLEEYINEIVQLVGDNGDTYKNLSKKHWLEEMKLKYHDQKIYDYFKSNFPELFED